MNVPSNDDVARWVLATAIPIGLGSGAWALARHDVSDLAVAGAPFRLIWSGAFGALELGAVGIVPVVIFTLWFLSVFVVRHDRGVLATILALAWLLLAVAIESGG